jgi:hypothetical protein
MTCGVDHEYRVPRGPLYEQFELPGGPCGERPLRRQAPIEPTYAGADKDKQACLNEIWGSIPMFDLNQAEAGKQRHEAGKEARTPAAGKHREHDRKHEGQESCCVPEDRVCSKAGQVDYPDKGRGNAVPGSGLSNQR